MAKDINITDLQVEVKKNGIFLKVHSDKPITENTVTGGGSLTMAGSTRQL